MDRTKTIIAALFVAGIIMFVPRVTDKKIVYLDNLETIEIDTSSRIEDYVEV